MLRYALRKAPSHATLASGRAARQQRDRSSEDIECHARLLVGTHVRTPRVWPKPPLSVRVNRAPTLGTGSIRQCRSRRRAGHEGDGGRSAAG